MSKNVARFLFCVGLQLMLAGFYLLDADRAVFQVGLWGMCFIHLVWLWSSP